MNKERSTGKVYSPASFAGASLDAGAEPKFTGNWYRLGECFACVLSDSAFRWPNAAQVMTVKVRIAERWIYRMRRVLATVCLGLLTALIAYKVICGANGMRVWESKRAEYQSLQRDIDHMSGQQQALQHEVDGLQRGDSSLIEKEAREQLGYVKPGEVVLFEQRSKPEPKPPTLADNTNQK